MRRFDHSVMQIVVQLCCAGWMVATATAVGHADEAERPCDLPPYDQIVLDKDNDNAVLKIEPLELPDRKLPAERDGDLTIRLLADPTKAFDVSWQNIDQVILFEDFIFAEAKRLTAAGDFDEAFDYYARLLRDYPHLSGLDNAINEYLRQNALALVKSQQYDRALAVLSTLYERAPNTPGIRQSVDTVCSKMVERQLREKDYAAARAALEVWRNEFRGLNSPTVLAWEKRFATAAERQITEARQHVATQDYLAARKAIGRARDIWPDTRDADQLLAEMQRINPTVTVGVFEASPSAPTCRIDDWAALRTRQLREPALSEMVGFGSEGGVYRSPFGTWEPDASGLALSLELNRTDDAPSGQTPSAASIARFLLNMADRARPEYEPDFAGVLRAVSIRGSDTVQMDWKHPHVRPEAWFRRTFAEAAVESELTDGHQVTTSRWTLADSSPDTTIFEAASEQQELQPWLRTIVEQTMHDDKAAVDALRRGEIDVLERVPPWRLSQLRSTAGINVASYALPTVHALVLNPQNPLLKLREFRRAISYAIPRDRIVRQVLLGGAEAAGFTVLSGPFPAGLSLSDPLRYAYNNQIEPRPFEPRLAAVLASVAWSKLRNPSGQGDVEPQPMPTFLLAHPQDPLARLASESIQIQLSKAGMPTKLVEFTADELLAGKVKYDLRYAELAVWEPVVDARAILGPTGLAGELCSAYLESVLNSLGDAANWNDVRANLAEIHDVAHHDLPLIPLWQTVNYFAFREGVQGIGESPVTIYQNVDRWRVGVDQRMAGAGH